MTNEKKLRKLYLRRKIPVFLHNAVLDGVSQPEFEHKFYWHLKSRSIFELLLMWAKVAFWMSTFLTATMFGIIFARPPFFQQKLWFAVLLSIVATFLLWATLALREKIKEAKPPELPEWWVKYAGWLEDLMIRSGYHMYDWLRRVKKGEIALYEKNRFEKDRRKQLQDLANDITDLESRKIDATVARRPFTGLLAAVHRFRIFEDGARTFFPDAEKEAWFYEI